MNKTKDFGQLKIVCFLANQKIFFPKSVYRFVSPEAAKLSFYYCDGKSVAMHLLKGPNYRCSTEGLKVK